MFFRIATLLLFAALVAVSTPAPNTLAVRDSQCNNGTTYCCSQAFSANTTFTGSSSGVLSATVNGTAITCDPVTAIGVGSGTQCTTQLACCTTVQVNGVASTVCAPISVDAA